MVGRSNRCGRSQIFTKLSEVVFYESTNIRDGDLSPLMKHRLSSVSFQNRRHYSHRREQFPGFHCKPATLEDP